MFLIVSKYLISKKYRGFTFYPFIIIRNDFDKTDRVLINHEKIHIRQQLELLILPFYIWYFLDFLIKIIRYKDSNKAYRNIIFEREAYAKEKDLDYLKSRSFWKFLKYF